MASDAIATQQGSIAVCWTRLVGACLMSNQTAWSWAPGLAFVSTIILSIYAVTAVATVWSPVLGVGLRALVRCSGQLPLRCG